MTAADTLQKLDETHDATQRTIDNIDRAQARHKRIWGGIDQGLNLANGLIVLSTIMLWLSYLTPWLGFPDPIFYAMSALTLIAGFGALVGTMAVLIKRKLVEAFISRRK